ncbi:MAG: DUF899 family protein [Acidobacteria bacterium]|nr:DUF899 family protein [Acidobacteriota bacterium]
MAPAKPSFSCRTNDARSKWSLQRCGDHSSVEGAAVPEDLPGISVFAKAEGGEIYHTYSTYSRGLDPFNATYQFLDIVPRGRDEAGLASAMDWLRRRDEYAYRALS